MIRAITAATAFLVCLASPVLAQFQDTARIGDQHAFHMGGNGVVRIPVYYTNPQHELPALSLGFTFATTGNPVYPDSITRSGRTSGTEIFNLFMGFGSPVGEPVGNPDSVCAGFVSLSEYLPPGSGEIAEMWFSGAQVGDLISIIPRTSVGACRTQASDANGPVDLYFEVSHLQVIATDLAISCATEYSVQATYLLTFPIRVYAQNEPVTLEIADFYGPTSQFPEPTLVGDGPWEFHWQPAYQNQGDFTLELLATDALGDTTTQTVTIHVTETTGDPGEVLRGDMDCDGDIDITDLLIMVNYMFNSGPPSECQ